jgi:NAD(P)H-hydrate epimerase
VQQAELMTEPLAETADGGLAAAGAAAASALLRERDALAIGPGLGLETETGEAVRTILRESDVPAVVDADALNALAAEPGPFHLGPGPSLSVLTPHPGEAARLLGCSAREVQEDRPAAARRLAAVAGAVVVLKGHRSLVAHPDGRIAVNASGNPGLASAGTGDVLTGIVGALLARGLDAWSAARLAVFVHGDAGDRAARALGQDGLIASDVIAELPCALAALTKRETGR